MSTLVGRTAFCLSSSVVSRLPLHKGQLFCKVGFKPRTFQHPTQSVLVPSALYSTKRKMAVKLTESERETQLKPLLDAGWKMVEGRDAINKTFIFKNFMQAWSWMSHIAMAGEKSDHHPEWFNVYNKVDVTWSTHDCGGLSARDIKMASLCNENFKMYN